MPVLRQARLAGGDIMFSICPFVRPSVRPSVCYQICEHDILKTNELILMHKWFTEQGHKTVIFGVRRSKVEVTRGRRYVWRSVRAIILEPLGSDVSPWPWSLRPKFKS